MRKLKTPTGELFEEFITASIHAFKKDGNIEKSYHDTEGGEYSGRFWFEHKNGKRTPTYTIDTAPKWLKAYYNSVTDE